MSDLDLLQDYARENSQSAFAALVGRHLNLVYSAALRQVRTPQLAEEIAQSVFLDLSRQAAKFPPDQPLAPWLYVVTRRTAVDVLRRESRRQVRERTAAEIATMKTPAPSWSRIADTVDEAISTLNAAERSAIVLRFFENQSLREVGAALGISDDAAQKRVTRALDQLRTFFARRGIAVTAAGLATDLSAQAILTAPAALTGAISAGVAHATLTVAAPAVGLAAMTTFQKLFAVAALTGTAGACLFQAVVYARQDSALADFHARTTALQHQLVATQHEQATLAQRLTATDAAIDARLSLARQGLAARDEATLDATLAAWLARARRLKSFAAARPDLAIPEFRLLTDEHWAQIAAQSSPDATDDSEAALKKALVAARQKAEGLFAPELRNALTAFLRSSDNQLPASLYQLLPHFDSPIAPDLFSRYRLTNTGNVSAVAERDRSTFLIELDPRRIVDVDTDNIVSVGLYGSTSHSAKSYARAREIMNRHPTPAPSR